MHIHPSGTHLYKRVCPPVGPSVGPYVRPLRFLQNRSFCLFSAAAMLRIRLNTFWDASRPFYLSVHPSICHSINLICLAPKSIHAETQSGRIVARSGLLLFRRFFFLSWISIESDIAKGAQSSKTTAAFPLSMKVICDVQTQARSGNDASGLCE